MRCLYCGKELALLKRWTGGGEFCSDAHRQQYQEEYNQLALNRLLQAKPREAAKPADPKRAESAAKSMKEPPPAAAAPEPPPQPPAREPEPEPALELAPAVEEPQPNPEVRFELETEAPSEPDVEEERAPADLAGLFIELPVPLGAEVHAAAVQGGFVQAFRPEFPRRAIEPVEGELVLAGHLVLSPSSHAMDYSARGAERRLEIRDFVRATPVFRFDAQFELAASGEPGLVEPSEDSMELLFFPHPPQPSPPLWQEDAALFAFGYELGALARVAFRTTGLQDNAEGLDLMPVEQGTEQLAGAVPVGFAKADLSTERRAPASAPISTPPPVPVIAVRVAAAPVTNFPAFQPSAPAASVEKKSEPGLVTRPLPLTLHGLAAGRGKPVQVFQAGVAGNLDIQAPRSTALPLRPVMTLGPAPAPAKTEDRKPSERTVLVKTEPKKTQSQPARPDPRFSNGKVPKPETGKQESQPQPAPIAATIVKEPVKEPVKEAVKEPVAEPNKVEAKPEAPPPEPKVSEPKISEPKLPEPLAKPYTPPDLGLPKLTLQSNGMSAPARIGIAAAALAFVGAVAFFVLHTGGSTVVANAPQVVAGSPLPALDSGWITDWGAEPGVRREHEISVLRPSLNLSDYRIEFQAQIENKALGWVFRATDGKDYYVGKLEMVTPGLEPVVDVVHFAVIDGQPQRRAQTPLPMKVRLDTLYKVRFDALGNHFTTWVQDQKVDDWTDERLKMGGAGLYNERGERMSLAGGVNVVPLVIKR